MTVSGAAGWSSEHGAGKPPEAQGGLRLGRKGGEGLGEVWVVFKPVRQNQLSPSK